MNFETEYVIMTLTWTFQRWRFKWSSYFVEFKPYNIRKLTFYVDMEFKGCSKKNVEAGRRYDSAYFYHFSLEKIFFDQNSIKIQ